ncbi:MAG: hypothetical protein K0V04_35660, partial [Deltaproteobacteria bacterium]|nr:hypothetical protein [Deltaproteobacteria bacterium]
MTTGEVVDDEVPLDPDELDWPTLDCDPITPGYCAFPFPSNVFTSANGDYATGRQVELPVATFTDGDAQPWRWSDGFSASAAIMTFLPDATSEGLPGHEDIDASLADDSPTVLIDAESGEHIAHFSELDWSANDPTRRSLFIRPVSRLPAGRRFIVAIRNVVDTAGAAIAPSPAFAALRDRTELADEPSVETRRALYGDIFYRLRQAGVDREDLQLAWDFHVATDESNTGWLLHMRDETFAALGDDSPAYTIDTIDTESNPEQLLYRIEGTFEAPLYLDTPGPNGPRLQHGDDGMPVANGTMTVPFWMIVPLSAQDNPAPLMQHGHGLLGSGSQVTGSHFREVANEYNYVGFGIDWIGMAGEDELYIASTVTAGNTEGLASMTDRMHQGALNQLVAMRMAAVGLAQDPQLAGLIDPTQRYWYGISQGGILGGVYMATTTEVERGVLDVPGQSYNLLLTRSVDFDQFFDLMRLRFSDPADLAYVLGSLQLLWDRVEPTGYTHRIRNPLPNTPSHEVLLTAALGDHQVTTLGAHHMARSIGATHLDSGQREIWGLPTATDSHTGSALVEYDFGLPPDPACNLPQTACDDPHGDLRRLTEARQQLDTFLRTGEAVNSCPGGVCSFPEQGECAPG